MPNWADTSYVISGDEKQVRELYETMTGLENRTESLIENGFGKTWLGNLVTVLGADWEKIHCRGKWENLTYEDGVIRFNTMTAWGRMYMVDDLIQEKYPDVGIYWLCEETGLEIFETNDTGGVWFSEKWKMDACTKKGDTYEYYSEDDADLLCKHISEMLGEDIRSVKEAKMRAKEYNEEHSNGDYYIYITEIEYNYD